ncbi:MAG TPA: Cro/Cl family transcriptional regulator [Alcanivorax sp.]|nr:Cro/Cl family transcriptional regulator [SAR202 cluster bacterium]HAI34260.1 Cro/Cl family transcriptional regulator [Alcanivorax sp.]HBP92969.1 Cro/Cl family transcriptional regulator [Alcanivorax sp.]|tara:strand:- start:236 stop:415 length:180 start_codon:yes stop_codon:yes gene_type:complete
MKKSEVIEFFGGVQQTADALGIRYQSVREWPEEGVPEGRQYQIQVLTQGELKADQESAA